MSKRKDRKNWHHRCPLSQKGTDDLWNMSEVNESQHTAFHTVFSIKKNGQKIPMTPQEIVEALNKVWLDHSYTVILYPRFPSSIAKEKGGYGGC